MRIYLIPGLGVDQRLFMNLDLPGHEVQYLHWIAPEKNESLQQYALRLAKQIDASQPFALGGVSYGGMCAVEIAKVLKPQKLILISSAKGYGELPWTIKLWRYFPLHRLFGDKFYITMGLFFHRLFGIKGREQKKLFGEMLRSMPRGYFMPACNNIINWRNRSCEDVLHVHGTGDLILPIWNVKNPVRIEGGSHVMVLNNAKEVSEAIMKYISAP
jgi:hypothetical protein